MDAHELLFGAQNPAIPVLQNEQLFDYFLHGQIQSSAKTLAIGQWQVNADARQVPNQKYEAIENRGSFVPFRSIADLGRAHDRAGIQIAGPGPAVE
jgi:hypothetical protein